MIRTLLKAALRIGLVAAASFACGQTQAADLVSNVPSFGSGQVSGPESVRYVHTDALGSPVAYTDGSGSVVERVLYEPYGAVIGGQPADGPGYTGHVSDPLTALTYMEQRYYDPALGHFLSVDPVTAYSNPAGSFNRYKYAGNSPYTFVDPDGRSEEAWAQLGDAIRFEVLKRNYRNESNLATKAKLADRLAFESRVKYGDRREAQRYQLEAESLRGAPIGIVYRRINQRTGDIYIGRANSPEHYVERMNAHNAKLGVAHEYEVVARAQPGVSLQVAEETQIREHGGLRREGGGLVNKRHEMREARYQGAGGRTPPPVGTRIRRSK